MAAPVAYLEAVVGMDITNFRRGAWKVRNELGLLADNTRGFMSLGRDLTFAFTTPLAVIGATIMKVGMDFDAQMRNINSIAWESEAALAALSDQVIEFGKNTRGGVNEAAKSLYTVYSAGLTGALAFDVMQVSTKTAEAGLADMEVTTEALVASMLSFGYTSEEQAWRASNALTRMVQVGVGSMQAFAGSVATFLPSAASLGVTIEEAYAMNARLTQLGYSANEAAVRVNAAMRSMIKPSEAMGAAMRELGANSAKELIEQTGGLTEAIIALRGTTDGTEEALAALFADTRALQGVLSFTRDIETTRDVLREFNVGLETATMRAWEEQSKSLAFQMGRLKSSITGAFIIVSQKVIPVITPFVKALADMINNVTTLNPELITNAAAFLAIAAAIPPILWAIQSLISAFNPLTIVMGAIITNAFGIRDTLVNAFNAVVAHLQPVIALFDEFFGVLFTPVEQPPTLRTLWEDVQGIGSKIKTEVDAATGSMHNLEMSFNSGVTLWDLYTGDEFGPALQEMFPTADEFYAAALEQLGVDNPRVIPLGSVLKFSTGSSDSPLDADEITPQTMFDAIKTKWDNFWTGVLDQPLTDAQPEQWWDRLIPAASDLWAKLQPELQTLWDDVKGWFLNTALPGLDELAGKGLTALAGLFDTSGTTGEGNGPVYEAIKNILQGDLNAALGALGIDITPLDTALGNAFQGEDVFGSTKNAFGILLGRVGEWLIQEAVPTASRMAGLLIGTLVKTLGDVLRPDRLFAALTMGAAAFGEAVLSPFGQGFADAMSLFDIGEAVEGIGDEAKGEVSAFQSIAEWVLGGIGDALAIAIIGPKVLSLLGVDRVLKGMFSAFNRGMAAGDTTTFVGRLQGFAGKFFAVLSAALAGYTIGVAVYEAFKEPIENFMQGVTDAVFGPGALDNWRHDLEMRIYDLLNSAGIPVDGGYYSVDELTVYYNKIGFVVGESPENSRGQDELFENLRRWVVDPFERFVRDGGPGNPMEAAITGLWNTWGRELGENNFALNFEDVNSVGMNFAANMYANMLDTIYNYNPFEADNSAQAQMIKDKILANIGRILQMADYMKVPMDVEIEIVDDNGNPITTADGSVLTATFAEMRAIVLGAPNSEGYYIDPSWVVSTLFPITVKPVVEGVDTSEITEGLNTGDMLPEPTSTPFDEAGEVIVDNLVASVGRAFATRQTLDENTVKTEFVEPVVNAVTPAFGEGGTLRTMFVGWATTVQGSFDDITTKISTFKEDTIPATEEIGGMLATNLGVASSAFDDLALAAELAIISVSRLFTLLGIPIPNLNFSLPSYQTGNTPPDVQTASNTTNNVTISGTVTSEQVVRELRKAGVRV